MFNWLKRKKTNQKTNEIRDLSDYDLPQYEGIVDVTNFEEDPIDGSMGYMSGCFILLSSNGSILILSNPEKKKLEKISINDIIRTNNNINNFDPSRETEVAIMTEDKSINIRFNDLKIKNAFWSDLMKVYS